MEVTLGPFVTFSGTLNAMIYNGLTKKLSVPAAFRPMFFGGNDGSNDMPKIIAKVSLRQIDRLPPGLQAVAAGALYIAIGATGSGSWIFRYTAAGRKRDFGLGSCRDLSRDEAQIEVQKLRAMVRRGEDPIDAKRAKTLDKALPLTFEQCARRFYKVQEAGWSASHRCSRAANRP